MRNLGILASLLWALPAAAQETKEAPELQRHEVSGMADIAIEQGANTSTIDLQYVFTPGGIDRQDEVIPALRRFVRHPSALWARFFRRGASALQTDTQFSIGGTLQPFNGVVYARGEVGIQRSLIHYDETREKRYDTVPYTLELGGRPIQLLSIGAFYSGAPIIGSAPADNATASAKTTRSGHDHTFGGAIEAATPDDRLHVRLTGFFRIVDWTFEGGSDANPGDMTIRAPGASLAVDYQLSAQLGLGFKTLVKREHWVDERQDDDETLGTNDLDRQVWTVDGQVEIVYWYRARYAFRFYVGGGYYQAPPLLFQIDSGYGKFGGGIIVRF